MELDGKSLPAFCPNPAMTLWSQHPRVYLDMSAGEAMCPYCGTRYRLKPGTRTGHH
ncbi:MAG: zinc-finger domain-containing protein [Lautropia sp.]